MIPDRALRRRSSSVAVAAAVATCLLLGGSASVWPGTVAPLHAQPIGTMTEELRQGPRLQAALDSLAITVGDPARVTLELTLPADFPAGDPRFPTWGETWGEAEVLSAGEVTVETDQAGRRIYRQTVDVTAFRPGTTALPPQVVAIPLAERTLRRSTPEGLALTIRSVLPADPEESVEAQPAAAPRALPASNAFWWTLAVMGGLAALLLYRLYRRSEERKASDRPKLAPLPELLAALAPLRTAAPQTGHAHLSHAVRRFLGRSLRFPAVESTTSEVRWQLRSRHVPSNVGVGAAEILQACDRIKFANQKATPAELASRIERAQTLAEELDLYLNPPVVDEMEGPGQASRPGAAGGIAS